MKGSHLSRKHYFLSFALVFTSAASLAILALCVAIARRNGSNTATIVAMVVALAVPMFLPICVAMFPRKPSQRANYPRIEHLRIAGKYTPTDAARIGVSPLYLP
jgi:Kef-type K+ transport system membrane component KefB